MSEAPRPTEFGSAAGSWSRKWLYAWLATVVCLTAFIIFARIQAIDRDHASANLNTVIGCLSIWIATVFFLLISKRWELSLAIGLMPVLAALVFSSVYRLERVDGELRPHFASRWSSGPELPSVSTAVAENQNLSDATLFQPRETDWNQFLGPTRNAKTGCSIDSDWQTRPPKLLWKQSIGEGWSGFAVQGDVAITMEQRDEQEWVSAYKLQSGDLLWRHPIASRHYDPLGGPGPRATPAIHEDKVYACSAVSSIVCLQLTTGKEIWTQELNQLAQVAQAQLVEEVKYGRSGSPLVYDKSVVVPLGGNSSRATALIAFDTETGAELWRTGNQQISYASPMLATLDGVEQILYPTKNDLLSCDPRTGQQLWRYQYDGSVEAPNVAQPIRLDDQTLFISKGYGVGARLVEVRRTPAVDSSAANSLAEQSWRVKELKENRTVMRTKFTNPVYHDDHIYGLSDGILECIEARSLRRKWKGGRYRQGQLLLLRDSLLVSAEDGRVVLVGLDPKKHQELAELPVIGDVTWNPPTLVGDRLLIRNSNEVACIQLQLRDGQQ